MTTNTIFKANERIIEKSYAYFFYMEKVPADNVVEVTKAISTQKLNIEACLDGNKIGDAIFLGVTTAFNWIVLRLRKTPKHEVIIKAPSIPQIRKLLILKNSVDAASIAFRYLMFNRKWTIEERNEILRRARQSLAGTLMLLLFLKICLGASFEDFKLFMERVHARSLTELDEACLILVLCQIVSHILLDTSLWFFSALLVLLGINFFIKALNGIY